MFPDYFFSPLCLINDLLLSRSCSIKRLIFFITRELRKWSTHTIFVMNFFKFFYLSYRRDSYRRKRGEGAKFCRIEKKHTSTISNRYQFLFYFFFWNITHLFIAPSSSLTVAIMIYSLRASMWGETDSERKLFVHWLIYDCNDYALVSLCNLICTKRVSLSPFLSSGHN